MDKRKANGTETPENEDRVLKRRKLAVCLYVVASRKLSICICDHVFSGLAD